MNTRAPNRRRRKRVAKKIAARMGFLHYGPHVLIAKCSVSLKFLDALIQDRTLSLMFNDLRGEMFDVG